MFARQGKAEGQAQSEAAGAAQGTRAQRLPRGFEAGHRRRSPVPLRLRLAGGVGGGFHLVDFPVRVSL